MNVRTAASTLRAASRTGNSSRHASVSATPAHKSRDDMRSEHGSNIYVYSHLQTRQVIYSLKPAAKNSHAISQLPYNGKKTVPRALRKDLWHPMATISFSPRLTNASALGLSTFHKMREFRRLHELLWPKEEMVGLSRFQRGRKLMDQKANSVADMAAALAKVFEENLVGKTLLVPKEEEEREGKSLVAKSKSVSRDSSKMKVGKKKNGEGSENKTQEDLVDVKAVIRWTDILDAEYAEKWPKAVVHDLWETRWNNRRMPEIYETPSEAVSEPVVLSEDLREDGAGKVVL